MNNILITGANGFIGRNTIKYLQSKEEINILGTSTKNESKLLQSDNFISATLGEEDFVNKIFSKFKKLDIIVHLAASLSSNAENNLIDVNCKGILQICELARKTKCKKIIYISSIPIIGKPLSTPITEEHSIAPQTLYHATKIFGEHVFNLMVDENLTIINLRIPSPIGADMPQGKIFSVFVDKCLNNQEILLAGKGERIQNYVDVEDIAQAIYKSISYAKSNTFNIASDKSYSNLELAQICKKTLSSKSTIGFSGKEDTEEDYKWIISIDKAKQELAYNPIIPMTETIIKRKKYCENNIIK